MDERLLSVQVMIVSWSNQHENAIAIAEAVRGVARHVGIVYSDVDPGFSIPTQAPCIRRPDHLFFGDKFQSCLEADQGDGIFLLVHADCACSDWGELVQKCQSAMSRDPGIGVWAPFIHYTGFGLERTRLGDVAGTNLSMVAHTDSIVFALSRPVVRRMQTADYRSNVYGWGVGWLAVAFAYANRYCAVVDRSIAVRHPQPRGYPSEDAARQRERFLEQMLPAERIQYLLLRSHMRLMDVQIARQRQQVLASPVLVPTAQIP